jgi:hypothetical protein
MTQPNTALNRMFDIMSQDPVAIQNDEGEQSSPLLQLPTLFSDWCRVWHCHAGGGHDLSLCLAKPIEFVVLISLMSACIWL